MGFGDLLKKAQTVGNGVLNAALEKGGLQLSTNGGGESNSKDLKDIKKYGLIKGSGLPVSDKVSSIYFSINDKKLVIFENKIGMFNEKNTLIAEYPIDEVVEIRNKDVYINKGEDNKYSMFINTLFLSSGEEFEINSSFWEHTNYTALSQLYEDWDQWFVVFMIINNFILKVKDAKTKKWINSFFLTYDGKAMFDENGGFDFDEYKTVSAEVFKKQKSELEKKEKLLK